MKSSNNQIQRTCLTCGRQTCDRQPEDFDPSDCKDWKGKQIILPPLVVELGEDGKCTEKGKADIKAFIDTHIGQNALVGRCSWPVTEVRCGKCDYYRDGVCKA